MKILLILVSPLFLALNYMSTSDIAKVQDNKAGTTTYLKKDRCEKEERETCLQIDKVNLHIEKYGPHSVDDESKPIFSGDVADHKLVTPCTSPAQCDAIAESLKLPCASFPDHAVDKKGNEVRCNLITGYGKKVVTGFYVDPALKASKDARDAAKAAKRQARTDRKNRLKTAKDNFDSLDATQKDAVLKDLLEESVR